MKESIQSRITLSTAPNGYFQSFVYEATLTLLVAELTDGSEIPAATLTAYGQTEEEARERLIQAWDFVVEKATREEE